MLIRVDMSKKTYTIFNIATGLLKGAVLLSIVFWLLPRWGINIPAWGLALIMVAFLTYEIITFRLGIRALAKKPLVWPGAIIGRSGKATSDLNPHGYVQVEGELWQAYSDDTNINKGDDIVVLEMKKLTLRVASSTRNSKIQRWNVNGL